MQIDRFYFKGITLILFNIVGKIVIKTNIILTKYKLQLLHCFYYLQVFPYSHTSICMYYMP